jgi:uncharacterized RDD family membrane protein YckC
MLVKILENLIPEGKNIKLLIDYSMQTVKITTSQNITIDYEIAGLGDRVLARLIDGAVFLGVFLLILVYAVSTDFNFRGNETVITVLVCILAAFIVLYDLVFEIFYNGQSIGKRAMKIKVISLDGSSPGVGQYLLRWIFRIVDFSLTSQLCALISVAVTEKNQRIGDLVAGTTLIKTAPRTTLDSLAFKPGDENYEPSFPQAAELSDGEISLIHEVLSNVKKSENYTLLHATATKIKSHLQITDTRGLDDETFLRTIVKDYTYSVNQVS